MPTKRLPQLDLIPRLVRKSSLKDLAQANTLPEPTLQVPLQKQHKVNVPLGLAALLGNIIGLYGALVPRKPLGVRNGNKGEHVPLALPADPPVFEHDGAAPVARPVQDITRAP